MCFFKMYKLNDYFKVYYLHRISLLCVRGFYGFSTIKLPSLYFFNFKNNILSLLFLNRLLFKSFINMFFTCYKNLYFIYSVRFRVRGLGFRIRKLSENFYYFFFNHTNIFYLHMPLNILFKWYKKKGCFLSNNYFLLKLLFTHVLLLRKLGSYNRRGFRFSRQIIFLRKGGKKKS